MQFGGKTALAVALQPVVVAELLAHAGDGLAHIVLFGGVVEVHAVSP